jgi:hypothetical protein
VLLIVCGCHKVAANGAICLKVWLYFEVEEKDIVLGSCMVLSFHERLELSCMVGHEIAGHEAWRGEKRNGYGVWGGNLKEIDRLDDVGIDGEIILKCTSNM